MASKPESISRHDVDDDFVILQQFENMADSGASSASTVPEKHTFETLEKLSDDSLAGSDTNEKPKGLNSFDSLYDPSGFSSLGDSRINDVPYYESSRFIDKQVEKEKMLRLSMEDDEKVDEPCSEKGGPVLDKSGEGSKEGEKGGSLVESAEGKDSTAESDKKGVGRHDAGCESAIQSHSRDGDQSALGMSASNVEHSWMYVEGDEGARSEGDCLGVELVDRDEQKEEVDADDEAMDKYIEARDGEDGAEEDKNLVGGVIESDGEGIVVDDSVVCETKAEKKDEINMDTADQTSHIENIPCDEQTDISKEHLSGADIIPAEKSMHSENESSSMTGLSHHSQLDPVEDNPMTEHSILHGQVQEEDLSSTAIKSQGLSGEGAHDDSGIDQLKLSNPNQVDRDATKLPNNAEQDLSEVPQEVQESVRSELANEGLNQPIPEDMFSTSPTEINEPRQDQQPVEDREHDPGNQPDDQEPDERLPKRPTPEQQPAGRSKPGRPKHQAPLCSLRFLLALLFAIFSAFVVHKHPDLLTFMRSAKAPLPKPTISMKTKIHVSPSAPSMQLVAKCEAYNSSYAIHHCRWRQIHPLATTPENTVFPGDVQECPPANPTAREVDASLHGLKVPTELGTYTFEVACGHEAGNSAIKRVEVWINELNPPIMTVGNTTLTVSTSTGIAKMEVSCRAVQGKIVKRKWEYFDGPEEVVLVTPTDDGVVHLTKPGVYKFKYRCTDDFGGTALSSAFTIHAKPPYVLGIDLGTSTTCIAIIKEDGTRQDIGIYEDESDVDPCIPSVVAFALNGDLLIGEKALRQAVLNPDSTIYEVKRLMGRSYYDDPDHKFSYRVRPTLKSHSLKGVRAAIEIPCGKSRKKLVQPELISALLLRHVANYAQRYLKVAVKDVVISVPAQFDDSQRKATMDAGLIAGLNTIKIVNEPTVAAFAANSLTEKLLETPNEEAESPETERQRHAVWAVVADIGGGTTDYALMQIHGSYYKVITTDGDKTLGGRDIDIRLTEVLTQILSDKYLGFDLNEKTFQQRLRIECELAKIQLSEHEQYSMTVDYVDPDGNAEDIPLEHLLTREEFESYVSEILQAMVKPLDSLLQRARLLGPQNVEELYLVGGTSHIPMLKRLLTDYFKNLKNTRHKDPVQLVSRGAGAFGAALTGLIQVGKMPRIDVVPLPISIAVDMDDMHVIFERNHLYPCIQKRVLTTYTNNQNAIVIKVYEGEGRTANECHFLGEFELSGIPPLPKNVPEIQATFRIDTNGILSVKASYGDTVKGMKLDVYSKSGGMIDKTRENMRLLLKKLMEVSPAGQSKCEALEDATFMAVIPVKPNKSNVLKLSVESEYGSVTMANRSDPSAAIPAFGLVAVQGLVTDYDSISKETDLDIVLVVDVSGSMAGVPIVTMKNVMLQIIDRLKENHRLGIVTYSTGVQRNLQLVSCTARDKQIAIDIVNSLSAFGSTNLYGGLLEGLNMAYNGGRRSRVLLFTDGYANDGLWIENEDIIREIVREKTAFSLVTKAQVTLSTFGYLGEHDEVLLQELATNVGGGAYNFLNENTALGPTVAKVLGDAIHTIAEKIHLSVTPLDDVQIVEAITNFESTQDGEKLSFNIPSTADQQSRHILLRLAVPPTREPTVHAGLYRVELTYTNTLTEREEGSEEFLYVARSEELDLLSKSRDVDEQLNRVFVARQIKLALEALKSENSRENSVKLLKTAYDKVEKSDSKGHTLSVCLKEDLMQLMQEVSEGDLNLAKKSLQDSLTSHWQEKGGRNSCYVTRKEDKMISIFTT